MALYIWACKCSAEIACRHLTYGIELEYTSKNYWEYCLEEGKTCQKAARGEQYVRQTRKKTLHETKETLAAKNV